ncbi:MAG: DUF134 domain-containing protein [bacterium]|nr:DUF134 domain-containing protein [bacterium]
MARPCKCRQVGCRPQARMFKPAEVPWSQLEVIELRLDELESLRLGDLEGLYHDAAAERMGVSRATFGRLVDAARQKVADALVNGKLLVVKGGDVQMSNSVKFVCAGCGYRIETADGADSPSECPSCHSQSVSPAAEERGRHGGGGGRGRCRRRREHRHCRTGESPERGATMVDEHKEEAQ